MLDAEVATGPATGQLRLRMNEPADDVGDDCCEVDPDDCAPEDDCPLDDCPLDEPMEELKREFGLDDEDLNLDLGPLGRLL